MRVLEILILFSLLASLIRYLIPPSSRPRWLAWLPLLTALVALAHLALEGYRWQMVPAYGLALLLLLLNLPQLLTRRLPVTRTATRVGTIVVTGIGLFFLALAAALPALIPVFRLPQPTGPYAVGTTSLALMDTSRLEGWTLEADDYRELLVQAWYPAEPASDTRPVPYLENLPAVHQALTYVLQAQNQPTATFFVDHLGLVQTHSYRDALVSSAQPAYPVLIFSHGYLSWGAQNITQMEELASHGYVVFSVSHPYESILVIFPDGRVIPVNPDALLGILQESSIHDWETSLDNWVQDELFLLNELERMNAGLRDSPFAGRLDLARLGIFGHSFGGSTTIRVCAIDDRCKAGITLDGGQLEAPYLPSQPFLHMRQEERIMWLGGSSSAVGTNYLALVRGARHMDFSDVPRISPLLRLVNHPLIGTGPIGGQRMGAILNAYTVGFFDQYLRGIPTPLLDGPAAEFPEVDFRVLKR